MKNLAIFSVCLLSASTLSAQQANFGYKMGYSKWFSLKDNEAQKKFQNYRGINTELFYRYRNRKDLAFEGGLQYARTPAPKPNYALWEPERRKDYISLMAAAQYQVEKWNKREKTFRTYFGIVLAAQFTQLTTTSQAGCFVGETRSREYSVSFLGGVDQVFIYELDKQLSLQSTFSVLAGFNKALAGTAQLNAQLGVSYRISP